MFSEGTIGELQQDDQSFRAQTLTKLDENLLNICELDIYYEQVGGKVTYDEETTVVTETDNLAHKALYMKCHCHCYKQCILLQIS